MEGVPRSICNVRFGLVFFLSKKWRTRGDDLGSFLSECVAQTAQAQNLTTDLGVGVD
jgi:hypothetical protein